MDTWGSLAISTHPTKSFDVQEVRNGMECGIGVKGYDVKVGDQIEVFDRVRVERQLESTGA